MPPDSREIGRAYLRRCGLHGPSPTCPHLMAGPCLGRHVFVGQLRAMTREPDDVEQFSCFCLYLKPPLAARSEPIAKFTDKFSANDCYLAPSRVIVGELLALLLA